MLFSIYPSDNDAIRTQVLEAARQSGEKRLFTSLHIPESTGFDNYLDYLKKQHKEGGFSFCADISPLALERLRTGIENIIILREYGIESVRVDFGFTLGEIKTIANSNLGLAINASVVNEAFVRDLVKETRGNLIAWHNYYPRPETGISETFFNAQNQLFIKHHIPIYAFIPGETAHRLPLYQGLPTLESMRYKNAYRNYLMLKKLCPDSIVVCAEGIVYPHHLAWIKRYENEHILTVPISCSDEIFDFLGEKIFTVRAEETGISRRLDGTRSNFVPSQIIRGELRHKGSLQIDLPVLGRYQGEIHIMEQDMPLNENTAPIADILSAYTTIIDYIRSGEKIVFIRGV